MEGPKRTTKIEKQPIENSFLAEKSPKWLYADTLFSVYNYHAKNPLLTLERSHEKVKERECISFQCLGFQVSHFPVHFLHLLQTVDSHVQFRVNFQIPFHRCVNFQLVFGGIYIRLTSFTCRLTFSTCKE